MVVQLYVYDTVMSTIFSRAYGLRGNVFKDAPASLIVYLTPIPRAVNAGY